MGMFLIPKRIRELKDKDGLVVLLGNTKGTLQRNVIEPLQSIWGSSLVSDIKSDNTAMLFGERCYCLGADSVKNVDRLRGCSIKYCYCDEIATFSETMLDMLKSRLDKPYSIVDATCNPDSPNHYIKKKLIDNKEIENKYILNYTIYDNEFLDKNVIKDLEKEYKGTVYFDRYILGKWKLADSICFPSFANNVDKFLITKEQAKSYKYESITAAMDLGGGEKSSYAMTVTGHTTDGKIIVFKNTKVASNKVSLDNIHTMFINFISDFEREYKLTVNSGYVDDNMMIVVRALNEWRYMFGSASKIKNRMPLSERPIMLTRLIGAERFYLVKDECDALINELCSAVFDSKADKGVILDDPKVMMIDCIDSFFYTLADVFKYLFDY